MRNMCKSRRGWTTGPNPWIVRGWRVDRISPSDLCTSLIYKGFFHLKWGSSSCSLFEFCLTRYFFLLSSFLFSFTLWFLSMQQVRGFVVGYRERIAFFELAAVSRTIRQVTVSGHTGHLWLGYVRVAYIAWSSVVNIIG